MLRISTHTLTWSVTKQCQMLILSAQISTHTLTWSVTDSVSDLLSAYKISTHTLTWSVTMTMLKFTIIRRISTHTLTWSVTYSSSEKRSTRKNFNSHAHVERDKMGKALNHNYSISTHTLTWSVTRLVRSARLCKIISTHTLTWSVTMTRGYWVFHRGFQLTRSRGA